MISLRDLYVYAENKNITCLSRHKGEKAGFCIKLNQSPYIVLNKKLTDTEIKEKCVLAEEIGHIESDILYYLSDYYNPLYKSNIDRAERKALDWKAKHLVEFKELKLKLRFDKTIYEIAEDMSVDEETVLNAIEYYKRIGRLK